MENIEETDNIDHHAETNLEEGTYIDCDDIRTEGKEGKRSGKDYHRS